MPLEIKSEPQQDEPQRTTKLQPSIKNNPETISITQKSQVKSFKCNRCQNIFSEYSDLNKHVKSCNYNFACQKCRKQYKELSDLNDHMKKNNCKTLQNSDEGVEVFQCLHCQKIFKNSKDLNLHKVIVHPFIGKSPQSAVKKTTFKQSNDLLSCRFCKKLFDNVINFSYHMCKNQKTLEQNKPKMLKCQFCGRFIKAEDLKTHIENHEKKAQKLEKYNSPSSILSCRFCKKTFKYVPTFTYHLSTAHGGENLQKNKVHDEKNKVHEEKKPDLLKLAVDMSGIEKQSKEPFINFFFQIKFYFSI